MKIFKFTYYFFKGLERNFKLIRYGDVPKIYRHKVYMDRYHFADDGVKGVLLSIKEIMRHLFKNKLKDYDVGAHKVLFCGGSLNNEKEFLFFSDLLKGDVPECKYDRAYNLSYMPFLEREKTVFEKLLSIVIFSFCCVYILRIKIGPISLKYLITYSKLFLQVYANIRRAGGRPCLAIVANDHTDFPVATSMVMHCMGVPVGYLQHAEISSAFPALDFDFSILRNQKSLEKYLEIGKVVGDIFIIPRRDLGFDMSFMPKPDSLNSVSVIIYISSIYEPAALRLCIRSLKANFGVNRIGVKPHPRSDVKPIEDITEVSIYYTIPEFDHVAIVPNSSVVIELLEVGVPVFQYFDLDNVTADYYGFVADKVAPEIKLEDLEKQFWKTSFFDEEWIERLSQYSPGVDDSWRESFPLLVAKLRACLGSNFKQ